MVRRIHEIEIDTPARLSRAPPRRSVIALMIWKNFRGRAEISPASVDS